MLKSCLITLFLLLVATFSAGAQNDSPNVSAESSAENKTACLQNPDEEKVYNSLDEMPQYPGGVGALMKEISGNIRYPAAAQQNGIQGRVIVQFIVTKDGSIGRVKVYRGKDPDLDKEAMRVVKTLKRNFTPGKKEGKAVNVWYYLPITFML